MSELTGGTKNLVADKKREWFEKHHLMTGYQKLCAMKFLHILFLYVYMTKALLAPMAACKMVQLIDCSAAWSVCQ